MDLFTKLTEVYKNYDVKTESDNGIKYFVIINPFWEENIRISYEDGIIFYFSFQHAHFDYYDSFDEDVDCLIEYTDTFLNEERVVIEFSQEGENLFGGDRYKKDIDITSVKSLLKIFTDDNKSLYKFIYKKLKGFTCRCSICSWNGSSNKNIDFIL